jgi:pimeloyl-ACP methyl ester carboxylesterase
MVAPSESDGAPVELQTLRWGGPVGPRVLLVHGVQAAAITWWQVADKLARSGAAVTAPDLRGHGASPSALCYGLDDFVTDLVALGNGWDLVVGHSLGGTVAARALAISPGFARCALLLEPVLELPEDDFEAVVRGQLAELGSADPAAFQASNPHWHPEDCRLKAIAAAACSPFVNEAVLRDNRPWSYAGLLESLRTPVVVLGGDPAADAMLDPRLGEALARANPNVSYRRLAGAGHSPHRDQPELVARTALDQLAGPVG